MLLRITVQGRTLADVGHGLYEVNRLFQEGYVQGHDRNEDGDYHFELDGCSGLDISFPKKPQE